MQTYDHALSAAEVACVAANGAGIFEKLAGPADLNGDEKVDLGDTAALAAGRLQAEIWP